MAKFLVTGGNGFLGAWLVRTLVERGHSVRVLHRKSSDMSDLENVSYESCIGDVTDLQSVLRATDGKLDGVFHIAAVISYAPRDQELMERVNVGGTRNVVEACLQNKVKRLVHTSSVVAVGASFDQKLLDETTPFGDVVAPFGYYRTKHDAEKVILNGVREKGLDAVMVNPSIMFGAGDAAKGSRKTHMKVATGQFPFYPPGGVNIMHVADAIDAHIKAFEKGRTGERYILGGENITIKKLFELLAEAGEVAPPKVALPKWLLRSAFKSTQALSKFGVHVPLQMDSAYISTLYHWYDLSKAKRELDLKTRPSLDAIKESVQWAEANGYLPKKK